MKTEQQRLLDIVGDFKTAILVTQSMHKGMHGRPMSIAEKQEREIWFLTDRESEKVSEIRADDQALVVMQEPSRFVCLSGTINIVADAARVRDLWRESFRPWFTGPEDPNVTLLRFELQRAEYWDFRGINAVRLAWDAAKAMTVGEKLTSDEPTRHGVVNR